MVALILRPIYASPLPLTQQISRREFFDAVDRGDLNVVRDFVRGGGDINILNATILGFSALFLTISHGPIGKMDATRLAIFHYLIKQKELKINSVHCTMGNALNYSVMFKREELIQLLIDSGIEIDFRGPGGATSLWYACKYGYIGIAKILLENGADPNVFVDPFPRRSMSCLGIAIQTKDIDLLKLLLSNTNLDVNQQYAYQQSSIGVYYCSNALHQAFENDFIEAIPELIAVGAVFDSNLTYRGLEKITSSLYQQEYPLKAINPNKYIDAVNEGFVQKEKKVSFLIDKTVLKKTPVEERIKRTHELVQNFFSGDRGVASIICSY